MTLFSLLNGEHNMKRPCVVGGLKIYYKNVKILNSTFT